MELNRKQRNRPIGNIDPGKDRAAHPAMGVAWAWKYDHLSIL